MKNIKNWSNTLKLSTAITLGGIILVGSCIIYAVNSNKDNVKPVNEEISSILSGSPISTSTEPEPVKEVVIRPYKVECTITHYFYDETASSDIREKSIVQVPGTTRSYMISRGVDYTYTSSFDVVATISGTITDKISDSVYGEMVVLEHTNGVKFIYASLGEIVVNKGQEVKQGDVIGKSGTSVYTSYAEYALHLEVMKEKKNLNPEKLYSTYIESI